MSWASCWEVNLCRDVNLEGEVVRDHRFPSDGINAHLVEENWIEPITFNQKRGYSYLERREGRDRALSQPFTEIGGRQETDEEDLNGEALSPQVWLCIAGLAGMTIGLAHQPAWAQDLAALLESKLPKAQAKSTSQLIAQSTIKGDFHSKSRRNTTPINQEDTASLSPAHQKPELTFNPDDFRPGDIEAFNSTSPPSPIQKEVPRQLKLNRLQIQWPDRPLNTLFEGEATSLVARAVGAAEGTRTPEGKRTPAYYGHRDPGNGVWNLGTFSYQHGARSPQEADRKQLQRLEQQAGVLRQQAGLQGVDLTLEEELNGIDLANQSPRAALNRGYIQRLKEARERGLKGSEAVIWARTYSYMNPRTGRWSAPGLGNTEASIRRDQTRRAQAVQKAIAAHQTEKSSVSHRRGVLLSEELELYDRPGGTRHY